MLSDEGDEEDGKALEGDGEEALYQAEDGGEHDGGGHGGEGGGGEGLGHHR